MDILLRNLPEDPEVNFKATKSIDQNTYRETLGLLSYRTIEDHQAQIPIVLLTPKHFDERIVIWIDKEGKAGLYTKDGSVTSPVRSLLEAGISVIGVDLLYQGEFLAGEQPPKRQRWLPNEEGYAGWTYCYNLPVFAHRVHDILAVIEWLRWKGSALQEIDIVGLNGVGHIVIAAVAQGKGSIARTAVNTEGFRFVNLKDIYDIDFMPGAAKYDDLPGLLALAAPFRIWLAGEGKKVPQVIKAAFATAGKSENLTIFPRASNEVVRGAIEWLLRE